MLDEKVRRYGTTGRGVSARENIVIKTTKAIHLLAATAWAGGAISMQALSFLKLSLDDPATISVVAYCLHFIDTWVVMPGLAGCVLTGIFYSIFTSIGFFKYTWIAYKWVVCACAGFWGTMVWGPWGDQLTAFLEPYGLAPLMLFVRGCILPENFWQAALQTTLIFSMLIISVYRPLTWRGLHRSVASRRRERDGE